MLRKGYAYFYWMERGRRAFIFFWMEVKERSEVCAVAGGETLGLGLDYSGLMWVGSLWMIGCISC